MWSSQTCANDLHKPDLCKIWRSVFSHYLGIEKNIYIIIGMGNTMSIFFVEFMPKKVYHVENSYSKDVLKAFLIFFIF